MVKKITILIGVAIVFVLVLLPLSSKAFPAGNPPKFIAGTRLQDSSGDLGANALDQYSVPCVVDWNEDGKQDLLVGYFIFGPIYLYLNAGTNAAPVFTTYAKLKADGADLASQWTWCMGSYPQIVDWNEDGKKDLLVGDAFGFITLYLNTGTNDNPILTKAGRIKVAGNDYNEGEKATPVVNDWNEDGKKDLIVGAEDGRIRVLINEGTNNNPVFNAIKYVQANSVDLDVSNSPDDRSAPEVADLDGDGLKDLIIGMRTGMVSFYTNSGTNANPVFTTGVNLQAGEADIKMGGSQDGYSRLDIVDWDGDNDLDLLVGELEGYVTLFRSTLNPAAVKENVTNENIPATFSLAQNYPNPFNPGTTIKFAIPETSHIRLSIYNARGQLQAVLVDSYRQAGWHEVAWDASHNASGIYFARLEANDSLWQIKMCVVK